VRHAKRSHGMIDVPHCYVSVLLACYITTVEDVLQYCLSAAAVGTAVQLCKHLASAQLL
jgi:hypothetical protein